MKTLGRVVLVVVLAGPLGGQALPSAADLVAKHTAAIGGRAALDRYTSMHELGTTSVTILGKTGPVGTTEVFRGRPNKVLVKNVHGPTEVRTTSTQGFDGTTVWILPGGTSPPMIPTGALATTVKNRASFFADLDDITNGKRLTTVSVEEFAGRKCYKAKFASTDQSGDQGYEYFDAETGLFAGLSLPADSRTGREGAVSVVGDYKDFGGVKFATSFVTTSGRNVLKRTVESIEFDTVDPAVFALPNGVKP